MKVEDSYHLLGVVECIDLRGEATIFTIMDPYNKYWKVFICLKDRHKTSFVCHSGTYRYMRMPFGPKAHQPLINVC